MVGRKGYKKAEVGVIPEEWQELTIKGNFDYYQNNTYARDSMNNQEGDIHNIHYGDVLIKYTSILDCEKVDIPFINSGISVNLVNRTIKSGDVIMADTAEDSTVGKVTEVINVKDRKIVSGLHTIFLRPHPGLFAERYLGYFMNGSIFHNQLLPYIVGIKVSSLSKKSIMETKILRPCIKEQQAIATAFSDIDDLIDALTKLIDKKKNIKQGAMQELLTGKKRLEGFSETLTTVELSTVCTIVMGQSPDSRYYNNRMKGVPLIQGNADIKSKKTIKRFYTTQITKTADKDDIVFTVRAPVGCVAKASFKCCLGRGVCALKNTDDFLFHYLVFIEPQWSEFSTGSTFDSISTDTLKKIMILYPNNENERKAISQFLSDMDAEIEALEQKLNKYKSIKQDMMQELLTGRIRLI